MLDDYKVELINYKRQYFVLYAGRRFALCFEVSQSRNNSFLLLLN